MRNVASRLQFECRTYESVHKEKEENGCELTGASLSQSSLDGLNLMMGSASLSPQLRPALVELL